MQGDREEAKPEQRKGTDERNDRPFVESVLEVSSNHQTRLALMSILEEASAPPPGRRRETTH